jgi:hypothetical protein
MCSATLRVLWSHVAFHVCESGCVLFETLHLSLSVHTLSNVAVTYLRAFSDIFRFFAKLSPHFRSVVTNDKLCIKAWRKLGELREKNLFLTTQIRTKHLWPWITKISCQYFKFILVSKRIRQKFASYRFIPSHHTLRFLRRRHSKAVHLIHLFRTPVNCIWRSLLQCKGNFKWFMTMHWWFSMGCKTNKCIYKCVNLW